MCADKLGVPFRKFDVVFTGNRGTNSIAIVIDENPTPAGYIRAVRWVNRFKRFDANIRVYEYELESTVIKDFDSTVHIGREYWTAVICAGVAAAIQQYGRDVPGEGK